jgi:hypothetical protein
VRNLALAALLAAAPATATPDAAARVLADAAQHRPLVAHVVVALCAAAETFDHPQAPHPRAHVRP